LFFKGHNGTGACSSPCMIFNHTGFIKIIFGKVNDFVLTKQEIIIRIM